MQGTRRKHGHCPGSAQLALSQKEGLGSYTCDPTFSVCNTVLLTRAPPHTASLGRSRHAGGAPCPWPPSPADSPHPLCCCAGLFEVPPRSGLMQGLPGWRLIH